MGQKKEKSTSSAKKQKMNKNADTMQFQPVSMEMSRRTRDGTAEFGQGSIRFPSSVFVFPVQLTTCRLATLPGWSTLAICMCDHAVVTGVFFNLFLFFCTLFWVSL